jgi:hypothetical protein
MIMTSAASLVWNRDTRRVSEERVRPCMACEEAELYFRWQLLEQIAKGEMPEG